jgi:hypothetical protein
MRIDEVTDPGAQKLVALSQFLLGRSTDRASKKQIDQDAFVELANSMGVNITKDSLTELVAKPPLKNILEPIEPGSTVVRFKGNEEPLQGGMSVDQAEQVVNKNAKAAMRRGMNK